MNFDGYIRFDKFREENLHVIFFHHQVIAWDYLEVYIHAMLMLTILALSLIFLNGIHNLDL